MRRFGQDDSRLMLPMIADDQDLYSAIAVGGEHVAVMIDTLEVDHQKDSKKHARRFATDEL